MRSRGLPSPDRADAVLGALENTAATIMQEIEVWKTITGAVSRAARGRSRRSRSDWRVVDCG